MPILNGGKQSAYILSKRDKNDVEEDKEWRTYIFPENLPAVILRPNAVTSFTPVIESQTCLAWSAYTVTGRQHSTYTPYRTNKQHGVKASRRKA